MRVDPAEYQALDLEGHQLLADVPLHDVWVIRLEGGGEGRTIQDVLEVFAGLDRSSLNPAVRALFELRSWLGRRFGWDVESEAVSSYVARLPPDWHRRSLDRPGSRMGFWRVVYTFEREAVGEVVNKTVHAFLLFALRPAPSGYRLYWAVYVKPVGRLTPVYMALIDPFRRWLVYPNMIRRIEESWERRWQGSEASPLFP